VAGGGAFGRTWRSQLASQRLAQRQQLQQEPEPRRSGAGARVTARGQRRGRSHLGGERAAMAEFPSKVSTRTSSPAQGAGTSVFALRPDLSFVRSNFGVLMLLQLVSPRAGRGVPSDQARRGNSRGRPLSARTDAPYLPWGHFQDGHPRDRPGPSHHGTPPGHPCVQTHCTLLLFRDSLPRQLASSTSQVVTTTALRSCSHGAQLS
jgi:hypothetical protein